jgi:hypothetical protein
MILRAGHEVRASVGQRLCVGADMGAVTFFDADERAMEAGAPALRVVE